MREGIELVCSARAPGGGRGGLYESVEEVADDLGCSSSHLYKLAKRSGVSLQAVIRYVHVRRALALKQRMDLTWTEVALRLRHPSSAAFANFVKRHWDMSPTEAAALTEEEWERRALERIRVA